MKKSNLVGFYYLMVFAAMVYLCLFIYKAIGIAGILVMCGIVIAGFILLAYRKVQEQANFDKLALYVLQNRLTPEEAVRINTQLMKKNFARATLIRSLQIIRDSIEIALSSKVRGTAQSRMILLNKHYQEILAKQMHLVSTPILEEIQRTVQQAERDFHTQLYINIANGYIEKVQKLKTEKSKLKNITQAIITLNEGLAAGQGDSHQLKSMLKLAQNEQRALLSK